jgi:RNA polymerase sigma-70 factor (ECF subfamily)
MTRQQELGATFELARPRLIRVAYAVLGSRHEAEDVVSETWLRLSAADAQEPIRDVDAWATVAVARAALDSLRSARSRREVYVGPWLPEPVVSSEVPLDPADRVTVDETVSYALLVVLESLTPAERTAWVLHDVFAMPFNEIADVVGRSQAAVRQLAARARAHLETQQPRLDVGAAEHDETVTAFLSAAAGGDLDALLATLDPDVVLTSDGGGQVSSARKPVYGADRVARFVLGIGTKLEPDEAIAIITVNGATGIGVHRGEVLTTVVSLTVVAGRVTRVDLVRAPEKLPRLS